MLFSLQAHQLHWQRAQATFQEHRFLFAHIAEELHSRLRGINFTPQKTLNLSPQSLDNCYEDILEPTDHLPFADDTFDLIVSCLQLHWVEDLQGLLVYIKRCLRPGGLFLGALWGGQTLHELRESFLQAELSLTGGASPRISPMLQPLHAPLLLGKAGFMNPVTDTETLTVTYESVEELMKDLRGMGEGNALQERRKTFTSRKLFETVEKLYKERFCTENGNIIATFEAVYLTGWKAA